MATRTKSNDTFWEIVEHANNVAGQLLRSHFGGGTNEDMVGTFMERQVKKGKHLDEIEEMLRGPMLYSYLRNIRNDYWRNESALKRGNGIPTTPIEDVDYFNEAKEDNPEVIVMEKESATENIDRLNELLKSVDLSNIQFEIIELDRKGYSNAMIAEKLNTDVNTVYSRRSEALRKLKKQVERTYMK